MCSVWIDLYCTEPIVYIFIRHLHFHSTLAIVSTICCMCLHGNYTVQIMAANKNCTSYTYMLLTSGKSRFILKSYKYIFEYKNIFSLCQTVPRLILEVLTKFDVL